MSGGQLAVGNEEFRGSKKLFTKNCTLITKKSDSEFYGGEFQWMS
ncbi:hypothetical protein [Clostridium algidicarnis]|nr:hypothetical protein [Clostridium algidicarnis]